MLSSFAYGVDIKLLKAQEFYAESLRGCLNGQTNSPFLPLLSSDLKWSFSLSVLTQHSS